MHKQLGDIQLTLTPQAGEAIWRFRLDASRLPSFARGIQDEGGQLLALWGSDDRHLGGGFAVHAAFLASVGLIWSTSALEAEDPAYPDLAALFPQAGRMQRAAYDLLGLRAVGAEDTRKWLRHNAWGADEFPLRRDFSAARGASPQDAYPFIRVAGDGVHEIPVGPIHAGTIEPGHFRFSVIGERILKLDRLELDMATGRSGDVLARVEVRFAEVASSLGLIRQILTRLPAGELRAAVPSPGAPWEGLGWVEGWRGPVLVALRLGADGRLDYVHPHDPSWQNWPLLELAVQGNIVPDFPLINKYFNLSYAGQDL
jgi:Ni,Fe-hydrogenase III component G